MHILSKCCGEKSRAHSGVTIQNNILRLVKPVIPKSDRICKKCSANVTEDEEHFLLKCPEYESIRCSFLQNYLAVPFNTLLNSTDRRTLLSISRYIGKCFELRKSADPAVTQ